MMLGAVLAAFFSGAPARADDPPVPPEKTEAAAAQHEATDVNTSKAPAPAPQPLPRRAVNSTADHSKFEALKGPFANGSEVTKACLTCHTEAGKQVMKSVHWTWDYRHPKTGQQLGKGSLVNTFCTNARGNEGTCATCHISYNWTQKEFDFSNQQNIDCVVCHDRTGTYYKTAPTKGNAACAVIFKNLPPIDLVKVAQSADLPDRQNCGACHFKGGGGDGVKHGDLDSSLKNPPRDLDVHMDAKGLNFNCSQCHVSRAHVFAGSRYDVIAKDTGGTGKPGLRRDVATCESCHGDTPHKKATLTGLKLNGHTAKVACQTCHIPTMARGGVATMVKWDWRTAGKTRNGEGYFEEGYVQGNGQHRHTYRSIKGDFTWGENLTPHYAWFDGVMNYTTIDTKFDPAKQPIAVNSFTGSHADPKSRIWPFKRMHTIQPYDKGNNTLVYMHMWGEDDKAFWGNYNFAEAIRVGMEKNGKPYSGEYGFLETNSYWPITHMVAPKEKALACKECHAKQGRLASLAGFYMPGRDNFPLLDYLGYLVLAGAFVGVIVHGMLRCGTVCFRKGPRHDHD